MTIKQLAWRYGTSERGTADEQKSLEALIARIFDMINAELPPDDESVPPVEQ